MTSFKLHFDTHESILQSIDALAERISNDVLLRINSAYYKLTDVEFYVHSEAMSDPYAHKAPMQLEAGKVYVHRSGVDITLGDGTNYGGMLLRGVTKCRESEAGTDGPVPEQFYGPRIVATELFSNLNPLWGAEGNVISLIHDRDRGSGLHPHPKAQLLKTSRVNLSYKMEDDPDRYYMNLPLRYITILEGIKPATRGIEGILREQVAKGVMSIEQARRIIGYEMRA